MNGPDLLGQITYLHLSVLLSSTNMEGKTDCLPDILIFVWLTSVELFLG